MPADDNIDEIRRGIAMIPDYPEDFPPPSAAATTPPPAFIDWGTFWDRDHNEAEWVFPDVLARGRGHALYAMHKAGKSLLMLYVAAQIATGRSRASSCISTTR